MAKSADVRQWALIGAAARLRDLVEEQAGIFSAFPELRRSGRRTRAVDASESTSGASPVRRRRRRKLTAEARKRISDAQKRRWAKQRAQQK